MPTSDSSKALKDLGDRYWTRLLQTTPLQALNQNGIGYLGGPLYATSIGDHRFDDQLDDLSPEAHAKLLADLRALQQEAEKLSSDGLDAEERISLQMLRAQLADAQGAEACQIDLWLVDPQNGPQTQLAQAALEGASPRRLAQSGRYFDQVIANLRTGLSRNLTASRANVQRVIEQLADMQARPPVLDGVQRFHDFLEREVLPKARPDEQLGVWALGLPGCYAFLSRRHTGTGQTPQELHELGLRELEKLEAEMLQLSGGVPPATYRTQLAARADQFKQSEEQLLGWYRELLARTVKALPTAFSDIPLRPLELRPVEAYRAPSFPAAYYQPPPEDGKQPGIVYVNTFEPSKRPLYNGEALLFHEAVPGHHLQGSAMLDLRGLPEYRRQFGPTAYIEGWALYCERMADETMHLYSSPEARFGMLGLQAWRAARLVVDTGMHELRWSRQRSVQFLLDHTTVTQREAESEIDRYAATPGQALGYMVGELQIFKLRAEAQARLGARFDLREFHARVLAHGPLELPQLAQQLSAWR